MRLVGILVALAILALLVARQPGVGPSSGERAERESGQPPSVPQEAGDVQQFEEDMDEFMDETEQRQRERLDEIR